MPFIRLFRTMPDPNHIHLDDTVVELAQPHKEVVLVNTDRVMFFEATRGGTNVILRISDTAAEQIKVSDDIVDIERMLTDAAPTGGKP